jgi:Spy/CpxP family protein refolding chaperone
MVRSLLISAALAAAIIVPAGAFAQQSAQQPSAGAPAQGQWQGHAHRHGGMMGMMRDLNLSDAQKTQIRQIMQQYRDSRTPGQRPSVQERSALHDKIMSVLTPQQRTQMQAKLQQMRQEREDRPEPGPESTPQA